MINKRVFLIAITLGLLSTRWLMAGEPTFNPYCALPKWLDSRCRGCCPDDYCKKCLPAIPCPSPCGGCDDYCKKCLPAIPCPSPCGGCDDYCQKCGPIRLSPCLPPWFTCGPKACCKCDTCASKKK